VVLKGVVTGMWKWLVVPILAALVAGACGSAGSAPPPNDLFAAKGAPSSLAADDPAWNAAAVMTIKTTVVEGSATKQGVDVQAQALYNSTDIWFRVSWPDATQTVDRFWQYDGKKWTSVGSEDRLALLWEITPLDRFQTHGCTALCHNPVADPIAKWYMVTPAADGRADNWQWLAGRTNPVGQFDDKYLVGALPDPASTGSSFVNDTTDSGGYTNNRTADGLGPAKMQDPAKPASAGPGFLLASEAVAIDPTKFKAGDKVPRDLLSPVVGSRGDIAAKGVWANGMWTVVFHRKLDTGNTDDIQFIAGRTIPFGLAVFDNASGFNHTVAIEPTYLKFSR
jgi:hypothetical protein